MLTLTKFVALFAAVVIVKAIPAVRPFTGEGTYDSAGVGACGITNDDDDDIAAVSDLLFDTYPGYDGDNPNENPLCGKTAAVTYNDKTINVLLMDRCEGCDLGDLNFSPHAFSQFAPTDVGRLSNISWVILPGP